MKSLFRYASKVTLSRIGPRIMLSNKKTSKLETTMTWHGNLR